jgi:hypothetical protein
MFRNEIYSVIYQNVPCIFDYRHVIYCWPSSHAITVVDKKVHKSKCEVMDMVENLPRI